MYTFSVCWVALFLAIFVVGGREHDFLKLFQDFHKSVSSFNYEDIEGQRNPPQIGGAGRENIISREIHRYFSQDPLDAIKYYFFPNSKDLVESRPGDENLLKRIVIPNGSVLKIVIHGFDGEGLSGSAESLKNAYLQNSNNPVLTLDWSKMSGYKAPFKYFLFPNISDFNVPKVSQHLAKLLVDLRKSQVIPSLDKVHIIGHSLGAQIAGQAGKMVAKALAGEKIGRITGLDPAGLNFKDKPFDLRLDSGDATFVDIIHTTGILGDIRATGDVDFYPNSASIGQPGCYGLLAAREACSHTKVVEFFVKSISEKNIFATRFAPTRARSGLRETPQRCSGYSDTNVVFGEYISSRVRGEYCLKIGDTKSSNSPDIF